MPLEILAGTLSVIYLTVVVAMLLIGLADLADPAPPPRRDRNR